MKINLTLTIVLIFLIGIVNAQTVEELYNKKEFKELIKFADKSEDLTKDELYFVGYAFFRLENDTKAIEMYDKAISKGLDDDHIYLYKGLSLRFDQQYDKAISAFKIAVDRNPKGQKNYTELANTFYYQEKYDSALIYFYKARELEFELSDPYFNIPNIYSIKQDLKKALEEFYISASLINQEDPIYIEILKSIGLLEYTYTKDYQKAINAYEEVIAMLPNEYNNYPKLIKAYYAAQDYPRGDSLIDVMKMEYEQGGLSEEYQKYGSVAIDEFEWRGQKVTTYKYFKETTETLDIMYKIYLLSKDGKSVERTLMTEKTIQIGKDGAKHLLCEREKNGTHHTYAYGWSTDNIDYESLKKSVLLVLEKEITPSGSSRVPVKTKHKKKDK